MTISFSGLASGLDTSSWVESLVALKRAKVATLEEQKSDIELTKDTINKIRSFFSSFRTMLEKVTDTKLGVASLDLFAQNLANSTNVGIVSATATTEAKEATYNITVEQLASNTKAISEYATVHTSVTTATLDSKLVDLGVNIASGGSSIGITVNGVKNWVDLTQSDTLGTLTEKLHDIGVDASFNDRSGIYSIGVSVNDIDDHGTNFIEAMKLKQDGNVITNGYQSGVLLSKYTEYQYLAAKGSTKLSDIGVTSGNIVLEKDDGSIVPLVVDNNNTINQFKELLVSNGIDAGFEEGTGIFTINNAQILTDGSQIGDSNLKNIFGIDLDIYERTQTSKGLTQVITKSVDRDTKMSELAEAINVELDETASNNKFTVYDSNNETHTITFDGETTLGNVLDQISACGLSASVTSDGEIIISGGTLAQEIGDTIDPFAMLGLEDSPYTAMATGEALQYTVITHSTATLNTKFGQMGITQGILEVTNEDDDKYYLTITTDETVGDFITQLGNIGISGHLDEESGVLDITGGSFKAPTAGEVTDLYNAGLISENVGATNLLSSLGFGDSGTISPQNTNVAFTRTRSKAIAYSVTQTYDATSATTIDEILGEVSANPEEYISPFNNPNEIELELNVTAGHEVETYTITAASDWTIGDLVSAVQDLGVNAVYNEETHKILIENAFFTESYSDDSDTLLNALGLETIVSGRYATSTNLASAIPVIVNATESTAFIDDYLDGNSQVVKLYDADGNEIDTETFVSGQTIGDLLDWINEHDGYSAEIQDGVITIRNGYIETASGDLENTLGLQTDFISSYAIGNVVTATTTAAATGSTSIADIIAALGTESAVEDEYTLSFGGVDFAVDETTTINDIISMVNAQGGSAILDMTGRLTVEGGLLSGTVADALGFQELMTTVTVGQTQSSTTAVTYTGNIFATESDLINDFVDIASYTNAQKQITIHSNGTEVATISISTTDTFANLFEKLTPYGINCDLTDGVIRVTAADGTSADGTLIDDLGMTGATQTVTVTTGITQTSSNPITYTAKQLATESDLINDFVDIASYTNAQKQITIHSNGTEVATVSISTTDTFANLFEKLTPYGINCDLTDGIIRVTSPDNVYADGTLINALDMTVVTSGGGMVTNGISQTSSAQVTYTTETTGTSSTTVGNNMTSSSIIEYSSSPIYSTLGLTSTSTAQVTYTVESTGTFGIDVTSSSSVTWTVDATHTVSEPLTSSAPIYVADTSAPANFMQDIQRVDTTGMTHVGDLNVGAETLNSGTYAIGSLNDFQNFVQLVNSGRIGSGCTFVLTSDISLTSLGNTSPIGSSSNTFKSTFDGNGHKITNVSINASSTDCVGLFGAVEGGTIKNLALENVYIKGNHDVGGIAGSVGISSTIDNCSVTGTIIAISNFAGGIAGVMDADVLYSNTIVQNCYASVSVSASSIAAGLVGQTNGDGTCVITNDHVVSNLNCSSNITGGLVGNILGPQNGNTSISACSTDFTINGTGQPRGGLVGMVASGTNHSISDSYWYCTSCNSGVGYTNGSAQISDTSSQLPSPLSVSFGTVYELANSSTQLGALLGSGTFSMTIKDSSTGAVAGVIALNEDSSIQTLINELVNNYGFDAEDTDIANSILTLTPGDDYYISGIQSLLATALNISSSGNPRTIVPATRTVTMSATSTLGDVVGSSGTWTVTVTNTSTNANTTLTFDQDDTVESIINTLVNTYGFSNSSGVSLSGLLSLNPGSSDYYISGMTSTLASALHITVGSGYSYSTASGTRTVTMSTSSTLGEIMDVTSGSWDITLSPTYTSGTYIETFYYNNTVGDIISRLTGYYSFDSYSSGVSDGILTLTPGYGEYITGMDSALANALNLQVGINSSYGGVVSITNNSLNQGNMSQVDLKTLMTQGEHTAIYYTDTSGMDSISSVASDYDGTSNPFSYNGDYKISTIEDWNLLCQISSDGFVDDTMSFYLANNIDFNDATLNDNLGDFEGSLYGNGYYLMNAFVGNLSGGVANQVYGYIGDLNIYNFTSDNESTGPQVILAGANYGHINNCNIYDSHINDSSHGYYKAPVAWYNSGTIEYTNVYNCTLEDYGASFNMAGFVNTNYGTISHCLSVINPDSTSDTYEFIGYLSGGSLSDIYYENAHNTDDTYANFIPQTVTINIQTSTGAESITFSSDTTLDNVASTMSSHGFSLTCDYSGRLHLNPTGSNFIIDMTPALANAFKMDYGAGYSYTVNEGGGTGTIQVEHTLTTESTLGDITGNSNDHTIQIQTTGGLESLTFASSATIGNIISALEPYNFTGNVSNGRLTITPTGDNFIYSMDGALTSALNISYGEGSSYISHSTDVSKNKNSAQQSAMVTKTMTSSTTIGEIVPGFDVPIIRKDTTTLAALGTIDASGSLSSGTYSISTTADLQKLSIMTANDKISAGVTFVLTNDIDMSGVEGFTPIGSLSHEFKGNFDGNGYIISNLSVSNTDCAGLFGCVSNSNIRNLGLQDVNIEGTQYAGGIAGRIEETAFISNCYVSGTVMGNVAGGIAGRAYSKINSLISSCYTSGYVISDSLTSGSNYCAGGIVGMLFAYDASNPYEELDLSRCHSSADVIGQDSRCYIGGLIGRVNGKVDVNRSGYYGNLTNEATDNSYTGGLVGRGTKLYIDSNSYSTTDCGAENNVGTSGSNVNDNSNRVARGSEPHIYKSNYKMSIDILSQSGEEYDLRLDSTWTVDDILTALAGYGIAGSINNGYLTLTPTGDNYIDSIDERLAHALGLEGDEGYEVNYINKFQNTNSTTQSAMFTQTITTSTTISDVYGIRIKPNEFIVTITPTDTSSYASVTSITGADDDLYGYYQTFKISSTSDLMWMSGKFFQAATFILENDIDMEGVIGYQGISIGDDIIIEGNGHVIKNLVINQTASTPAGFITNSEGYYSGHNVIQNLGFENIYVEGTSNTGGIAGEAEYTDFKNCFVTGTVKSTGLSNVYVGGILGKDNSPSQDSNTENINVQGVNVSGNSFVHPFAGNVSVGDIHGAYYYNLDNISELYGFPVAGAFADIRIDYGTQKLIIGKSYDNGSNATINVTNTMTYDDLFTELAAFDIQCSIGTDGKITFNPLGSYYIRIVDLDINIENALGITSGNNKSYIRSTTSFLKNANSYEQSTMLTQTMTTDSTLGDVAGKFINTFTVINTTGNTVLSSESIAEGTALNSGTYLISTTDDLEKLARMTNAGKIGSGATFVMTNDLNMSGIEHTIIGTNTNRFNGTFDGQGHVIHNLSINHSDDNHVGLFGYLDSNAIIKNVGLENVDIEVENKNQVGALVGEAGINSTISNCYATGNIIGNEYVGGLVGLNSGTIKESYTTETVIGNSYAGGFVGGMTNGSVENCCALGTVSGTTSIGGFAGSVTVQIGNDCYALNTCGTNIAVGLDNSSGCSIQMLSPGNEPFLYGQHTIQIQTTSGLQTLTFSSDSTIDDVISSLAGYDIAGSVVNGVLTLTPTGSNYIADIDEQLMNALKISVGENNSYTTEEQGTGINVSTIMTQQTVSIIRDNTTLEDLGVTDGLIYIKDRDSNNIGTINIAKNATPTIGDFKNLLATYGFMSTITGDGKLEITSADGNILISGNNAGTDSNILDILGIDSWQTNGVTQISDVLSGVEGVKRVEMTDKISSLANADGYQVAGEINVYHDGTRSTVTVDANETFETLSAKLSQYGITMDLSSDEILYFSGDNDTYMEQIIGGSQILDIFGIASWDERRDTVGTSLDYEQEEQTEVLTRQTKLKSLGVTNGSYYIYENGVRNTATVTNDTTVDDLIQTMNTYGLITDLSDDGKLSVSGHGNSYIATSALMGANSNIASTLFEQWHFTKAYESNGLDVPSPELTAINRSTKLSEVINESVTGSTSEHYTAGTYAITKDGVTTTHTLTADDTVGTFLDELGLYGFDAVINDSGQVIIRNTGESSISASGVDGESNVLELLGMSDFVQTYSYSGDALVNETVGADRNTKLSTLGVTTGEFTMYKDGVQYKAMISNDDTIGSLINTLNSFGFETALLTDGNETKIKLIGTGDTYIGNSGTGSNVAELFDITDGAVQTLSSKSTAEVKKGETVNLTATEDTFLRDLIKNGNTDITGDIDAGKLNDTVTINTLSFNISGNDTVGTLLNNIRKIGFEAVLGSDGKITVYSPDNTSLSISSTKGLYTSILNHNTDISTAMATSDEVQSFISEQKNLSVSNWANIGTSASNSTSLKLLNITEGTFTVYKDGKKGQVTIGEDWTFYDLQSALQTKLGADFNMKIDSDGYLVMSSPTGDIMVGATTDTSNFASITGMQSTSNGNSKSTHELYCVSNTSKVTQSGIFRRGNVTAGSFTVGNATITITDDSTIQDIASQINSNEDTNATAYWDNVTGQFVIESRTAGSSFVNIESVDTNFTDIMGLTLRNGYALNTSAQTVGKNAKFTINGTEYTSTSNTVGSDVSRITGVTLNLNSVSEGETVKITIERDKETLANAVEDVVNSYNELMENVDEAIAADGQLHKETTLKMIREQLRNLMTSSLSNTNSTFKNLVSVGISTSEAAGGNVSTANSAIVSLSFDRDKFIKAFSQDQVGVKALLVGLDSNGGGVFDRVETLVESALKGVTGYFDSSDKSYSTQISNLNTKIKKANEQVERYKKQLEAKFKSMDMMISQMQQQYSSFLTT